MSRRHHQADRTIRTIRAEARLDRLVHRVQQSFEATKADPTPIYGDSTFLRQLDSGYYEVVEIGELSDALAWQPGDVLLALDGHRLDGMSGVIDAYTALAGQNSFELTIQRGAGELQLRYRVE